jgi:hypothetical protein
MPIITGTTAVEAAAVPMMTKMLPVHAKWNIVHKRRSIFLTGVISSLPSQRPRGGYLSGKTISVPTA